MVLSEEALTTYKWSMAKHVRRAFKDHPKYFGRVQMFGSVDDPVIFDWAESFGFELEGELKNFGPGAKGDFWLFGRVN